MDKVKFLFENKISAHIDTKDNLFYNGIIVEFNETFLVINDRVCGSTPISFSELKEVNKFRGELK